MSGENYNPEDMFPIKDPVTSLPPPFAVDVPLVVAKGDVVIVHQYPSIAQSVAGALGKVFSDSAQGSNPAPEVKVYSKEEFAKIAPDYEKNQQELRDYAAQRDNFASLDEGEKAIRINKDGVEEEITFEDVPKPDPKFVSKEVYESYYSDIKGNNHVSNGSHIREVELNMKGRMEDVASDVTSFKRGLVSQQVHLDHQKHLVKECLTDDSGDLSLKRALQPGEGMMLGGDDYLEKYDINKVSILVASDEIGGIVHVIRPEEGSTGEMKDAFVYRTKEQLDEMREDGMLLTSQQLGEDIATRRWDSHDDWLEIKARVKEMGHDLDSMGKEGVDLQEFQKSLDRQQNEINTQMGELSEDYKGAQLESSVKAEIAVTV